jgi:hypothetical protein
MSFTPIFNANNGTISYNSTHTLNSWIDSTQKIGLGNPYGNVAMVDSVYGNDSSGSFGGTPFLTINAAIISAGLDQ